MRAGRLQEAHQHCLAILQLDQTFADAWFLCGVIAAHNGQITKAVAIIQNALALAPDNTEYLAELARQQITLQQSSQALLTAQRAFDRNPANIPTLNTLGTVFSHCGDHERALACFERAAQALQKPDAAGGLTVEWRADLYFNLAASLQFAGHFPAAEAAYHQALALQPLMFKAHSALSLLRTQTPDDNHLDRLQSLRGEVASPLDQLHLGHAIAKEEEDLGRYPQSLASLGWGKTAQARHVAYRAQDDTALFATIRRLFKPELFSAQQAACDSVEPIFIVGMPRTGTTLAEQILASHSAVQSVGELQNFPLQVKRMTGSSTAEVLDIDTMIASAQLDMAALGAAYIESTRPRTGQSAHFIDKLPLNFMYLGLIKLALPNARLICLRRDPMDTCLSNYRQLFATNFRHYHYNYDLLDCGRYFIEFDRLLRHWRDVMPGAVLELQYEALVANPEQLARELVHFCGLPWEDQCLSFHQRKSSVATPSAVQVRQTIYTSSVDRWRRYGDALQPLYELLESAGFYP